MEGFRTVFDLGHKEKKGKSWTSVNSWKKVEERKAAQGKVNDAKKEQKKAKYQRLDKELKSSLRNDKRKWANSIAQEAEDEVRVG